MLFVIARSAFSSFIVRMSIADISESSVAVVGVSRTPTELSAIAHAKPGNAPPFPGWLTDDGYCSIFLEGTKNRDSPFFSTSHKKIKKGFKCHSCLFSNRSKASMRFLLLSFLYAMTLLASLMG